MVHAILDNYVAHRHPKVRAWLDRHPREVIMLVGIAAIAIWLIRDVTTPSAEAHGVVAVAARLLWAALTMIVSTIAASIGMAVVGGVVTRNTFKDERADERDKAVYARSMRNAYFVVSVGGLTALLSFALGYDPALAAYAVFIGGLLAGAAGALSQLVYYRIG